MVKEKNHTNRNQSYKAHRNNGLKKKKKERYGALKGVSLFFFNNLLLLLLLFSLFLSSRDGDGMDLD